MKGLADKRVIVTGAASGIGAAITARLAEEGVVVGAMDRDAPALGELGVADVVPLVADITSKDAVDAAVGAFGSADGLVNCAGWDQMIPFLDTDPEFWRKVIDINLVGLLNVTHRVLVDMAAEGRGRVVSIASDAGRVGSSGEAVYSACKGGMIAFMKTLAREHARAGITFNTVCPGPTDTPLLQGMAVDGGMGEKIAPALAKAVPMRRVGQPTDLAGIVTFLLSDEAAFITGQTVSVSGGLTMA